MQSITAPPTDRLSVRPSVRASPDHTRSSRRRAAAVLTPPPPPPARPSHLAGHAHQVGWTQSITCRRSPGRAAPRRRRYARRRVTRSIRPTDRSVPSRPAPVRLPTAHRRRSVLDCPPTAMPRGADVQVVLSLSLSLVAAAAEQICSWQSVGHLPDIPPPVPRKLCHREYTCPAPGLNHNS